MSLFGIGGIGGDLPKPNDLANSILQKAGITTPSKTVTAAPPENLGIPRKSQDIDATRWNQLHVYSFVVKETSWDGSVLPVSANSESVFSGLPYSRVDLQIPPSSISATTAFASSAVATNGGILEENNGVVFRTITISGTTGFLPGRQSEGSKKATFFSNPIAAIFPAASEALSTFTKTIKGIANSLGGEPRKAADVGDLTNTGYYQFWKLHNLFVSYAEAKKKSSGKDLRLVFSASKDNIGYVITPVSFDIRKDASQPMLYRYSIVMKCWDITTSAAHLDSSYLDSIPNKNNIGSIRDVLNLLRKGRLAIAQASNVLRGVQSDINDITNSVNQTILIGKDAIGLASDAIDFLPTLKANVQVMSRTTQSQFNQALKNLDQSIIHSKNLFKDTNASQDTFESVRDPSQPVTTPSGVKVQPFTGGSSARTSGGGTAASSGSTGGSSNVEASSTGESRSLVSKGFNAQARILDKALSIPAVADAIPLSKFKLPPSVQEQITAQITASKEMTAGQVRDLAAKIQELGDNHATSIGGMDSDYAAIYGLPAVDTNTSTSKTPTEDDILLATQIQDMKEALTSTLASGTIFKERQPNPFDGANAALNEKEQIVTPTSAFPITVSRGASLEDIALQYLGDANRAKEIAMMNNMRAPYIDTSGFTLPIASCFGRTFIAPEVSKIILNQFVTIQGTGQSSTKRRVLSIEEVGGSKFKITVDGKADLDRFSGATSPFISSRLPGTVGPGDILLMPSMDAPDDEDQSPPTPLSSRLSHAEKVFKIDLLLDEKGDLAIGPSGDLNRSYGYTNAIQALRILVETDLGELNQHRNYGVAAPIGARNADITEDQVIDTIRTAVTSDSRFADANVAVTIEGKVARVRIEAYGHEGTGRIPVEFQVSV